MYLPVEGSLNYLSIIILAGIGVFLSVVIMGLNKLTGRKPSEITRAKYDTYECGVGYEGSAHQQFSVRYYVIGIIFLIFDVEVVFMYPWTLAYKTYLHAGPIILYEMGIFFALLFGGYIYLRLRGALSWD